MQNGQPSTITPSSYGMPLTCVCTPSQAAGLGAYSGGLSTIPTMGQSGGQSMVYNVPGKNLILTTFMKNEEYSYVFF